MKIDWNIGRNPFNQNFPAEIRKFLGVEWIAAGSYGLVQFHSQNEFRARSPSGACSSKMKDAGWISVARIKARVDDEFDRDINDNVWQLHSSRPFPDSPCSATSNTTYED